MGGRAGAPEQSSGEALGGIAGPSPAHRPRLRHPQARQPLFAIHETDVRRLVEGPPLVIGGVTIPHSKGADAHSDGDALYHSVVDAILGALTLPDIGQLFPDNDPRWKGADSSVFMEEAFRRMEERGYRIGNLDVTLILQAPKEIFVICSPIILLI